ncbi:hypothetical protein GCM10020000_40000 [Streptomyces olivoverticillatus]
MATVRPVNIIAMAPAFFCGATSPAATIAPMPKNAPCAREAMIRPASIRAKTGGRRGERIAHDEQPHEGHQHALARDAAADDGEDRGPDDHPQRIAGGQEARGGDGDTEVAGDLGEQARDHELGGADTEGADGERQQGKGHDRGP